eukprot:SAG31_NODE_5494_length_2502_cov_3.044944_4_plen_140_part_00
MSKRRNEVHGQRCDLAVELPPAVVRHNDSADIWVSSGQSRVLSAKDAFDDNRKLRDGPQPADQVERHVLRVQPLDVGLPVPRLSKAHARRPSVRQPPVEHAGGTSAEQLLQLTSLTETPAFAAACERQHRSHCYMIIIL